MTVFAQHGYGKTDKIERGLRASHISGVILSPRDESPQNLSDFNTSLRQEFGEEVEIIFDPQFFASTLVPVRDRYLPDYPYYSQGLTRADFISQADINRYASLVIEYQQTLDIDYIIGPTVFVSDLNDPWSQIALSLSQESLNVHGGIEGLPPLLLSIVLDEPAIRNRDSLDEFLDIISVWEVEGFYIIVRPTTSRYPTHLEENSVENLLYLVYVLAEINGFSVILGYTDLVGFIAKAVGAKAIGTGWYNTLRQFSLRRFQPSTGGRQRRDRYTSTPILSSLLVNPELETISQVGLINNVLSGSSYDQVMAQGNPANAIWPFDIACLHHWEVINRILQRSSSGGGPGPNLDIVERMIQDSEADYRIFQAAGVVFDANTGPGHLELWTRAIRNFRVDAGI